MSREQLGKGESRKMAKFKCERCWWDAWGGGHFAGCESQTDRYHQLLEERKENPCTPKQEAGSWWDEEHQCDSRLLDQGESE